MGVFEDLLSEGMALDVESHWGAGFLRGRYLTGDPTWTWRDICAQYLTLNARTLDMGTGDGSVLLSLDPLPAFTVAYEEWWPTIPTAVKTLRPHGVHLIVCLGADDNTAAVRTRPALPFGDESFSVVLNRHEAFAADDVRRVLTEGGVFVTQQVGSSADDSIRALLDLPAMGEDWSLDVAVQQLQAAGMTVIDGREESVLDTFTDVAALIGYVRSTPWAVPEFDVDAMTEPLLRLHQRCQPNGVISAASKRFWVSAARDRNQAPATTRATLRAVAAIHTQDRVPWSTTCLPMVRKCQVYEPRPSRMTRTPKSAL